MSLPLRRLPLLPRVFGWRPLVMTVLLSEVLLTFGWLGLLQWSRHERLHSRSGVELPARRWLTSSRGRSQRCHAVWFRWRATPLELARVRRELQLHTPLAAGTPPGCRGLEPPGWFAQDGQPGASWVSPSPIEGPEGLRQDLLRYRSGEIHYQVLFHE